MICLLSGADQVTISLNTVDKDEYYDITGGLDFDRTMSNLDYLLFSLHDNNNSKMKVKLSIVDTGNPDKVKAFRKRFEKLAEIRVIHLGEWRGGTHLNKLVRKNKNC